MKRIALIYALTLLASSAIVSNADAQGLSHKQALRAAGENAREVCTGLAGCTSSWAGPCQRTAPREFKCAVNWRIADTEEEEEEFPLEVGEGARAFRCAGIDDVYLHEGHLRVAPVKASSECWEA